jgi:hypothetical protein
MRCWKSAASLALLLAISGLAARADFSLREVQARLEPEALRLSARAELGLNPRTEQALAKGIPLEVVLHAALVQNRRLLWDVRVADWELRWRIQFHALSGQYLVSGLHPDLYDIESFATLSEALAYLGTLKDVALPLTAKKQIGEAADYSLHLRVQLDIEALPSPLRPMAYTTPAWHLNSGWTLWPIQH